MILTQGDKTRGLILIGWVAARASDLQFDRAAFIAAAGLLFMAAWHWIERRLA